VAPGGRVNSARQKDVAKGLKGVWRLAAEMGAPGGDGAVRLLFGA